MHAYADPFFTVGAVVHGEYEIREILKIGEDPLKAEDYKVQVVWVGLEEEEPTQEPLAVIVKYVTKFLVRRLTQMRLAKPVKNALRQRVG